MHWIIIFLAISICFSPLMSTFVEFKGKNRQYLVAWSGILLLSQTFPAGLLLINHKVGLKNKDFFPGRYRPESQNAPKTPPPVSLEHRS